jgi:hypothetical protein
MKAMKAVVQGCVLAAALVAGLWAQPARADVDDGETIIIDGCVPGKVEFQGECRPIEEVLQFRRAGSTPTMELPRLDWGLLIIIDFGLDGEPNESCHEQHVACTDEAQNLLSDCAARATTTAPSGVELSVLAEAERYCRHRGLAGPAFRNYHEWDTKECERFRDSCHARQPEP